MGLMSFIKKQFLDIIELPQSDDRLLSQKYPMQDQEIQYGATLIVRESQMAVFVNEGKLADVFGPGTYTLNTKNIPLLTNLKNWDKLFDSPFKSDVYFFNTKLLINNGWGTPQPITIREAEFGSIRIRAFGKYTYKISNPKQFFTAISGATDFFERETLESQLKNIVVSTFTNFLGQSKIPFLDMAGNQTQLADLIKKELVEQFASYGLEISQFMIENLNLPENLQKALDEKSSMGIVGDLSKYTQYQMAKSIPLAAQTENSAAGQGMGLAMGLQMAQTLQQQMTKPVENSSESLEAKLLHAKSLFDKKLITEEEYNKLKTDILSKF